MSDSVSEQGRSDASIDAGLVMRSLLRKMPRILFVTVLLCAVTFALLLFAPKIYESRAELLIEPRSTVFTGAASNQSADEYYIDTATVASQIELIKSRDTIRAAIAALNLEEDPAFAGKDEEAIITAIADNLLVTQERSSRLISVAFRSEDPDLAARIANGVAIAHVNRRAGLQISDTIDATAWLEREIEDLRVEVSEAERAIADFRVDNDLFVGSNNESLTNQQLSSYTTQIAAAAERRNSAQSKAQLIRSLLESGQSVTAVSDVQASPVVQQLTQELSRLQSQRAQQSATLLPNHPTVRALDAQITEINAQLAVEGRRVAQALEAQAQIESNLEQSLRAELNDLKVTAGGDTIEGVTLAELEREATAKRDLLNAYLLRYTEAAARADSSSALPDVRVVSEAAPPVNPSSPKSALVLMAVAIVSILLQVGAAIFSELLSGRALVERRVVVTSRDELSEREEAATEIAESIDNAPVEPLPLKPAVAPVSEADVEIEAIAASALAGITRTLVIAARNDWKDSMALAERITARAIKNGQSVAEIDAASEQRGVELGLTDLCSGEADFGDVVHRGIEERFAFVPWGQDDRLSRNTEQATTLVEALSDIYELVVVVTGKVGLRSSLPLFSDLGAKCLVVADGAQDTRRLVEEIESLGFSDVEIMGGQQSKSEVA